MTHFELALILAALVFSSALFLCLWLLIKQNLRLTRIEEETKPVNSSLMLFTKEMGELKEASRGIELVRQSLEASLKSQDQRLKPIDEGMTHLLSYFGGLKKNAGKVGELTFELLTEQMPQNKILKNLIFENQSRLEFLMEVAGEWVPVDSKFSKNPKQYFKKAASDVSSKYLGKKITGVTGNPISIEIVGKSAASYGLVFFPSDEALFEVYSSDELRQLMLDKRVWAVSPSNLYWQLFYFRWFESQIERAKDSSKVIKAMNLGSIEINKSLESLDLVERQIRQSLANFEKTRDSMKKIIKSFDQGE